MEYKVVACYSRVKFEKEVNQLIKDGWKLQGFMQHNVIPFSTNTCRHIYTQALTKE
ncbi:MAG: DUF1737 domain-containing protein [Clostridia bacterium]|nr:DUF1737 domain-containing protein [Clostridia bacterium]